MKNKVEVEMKNKEAGMSNAEKAMPECLPDVIQKFHKTMEMEPIYVCTSCHQTWFKHSVHNTAKITCISQELEEVCYTSYKSVSNVEWLSITCYNHLRNQKVPPLCVVTGLMFPPKPQALHLSELD